MKVPEIHSENTETDEEKHRLCRRSDKNQRLFIRSKIPQRPKTCFWNASYFRLNCPAKKKQVDELF